MPKLLLAKVERHLHAVAGILRRERMDAANPQRPSLSGRVLVPEDIETGGRLMSRVAIPQWTATGILPPIDASRPASSERSPYRVSLSEVVLRFNTSPERQATLDGLLRYRSGLHAVGLTRGFQWLDGSFLENIEMLEERPPNDLDLVTFFHLPAGATQLEIRTRNPGLFPLTKDERLAFKNVYNIDAYLVDLATAADRLIERSVYWYSMWSHRRDARWKGYLTIDLDSEEDGTAAAYLNAAPPMGTMP